MRPSLRTPEVGERGGMLTRYLLLFGMFALVAAAMVVLLGDFTYDRLLWIADQINVR